AARLCCGKSGRAPTPTCPPRARWPPWRSARIRGARRGSCPPPAAASSTCVCCRGRTSLAFIVGTGAQMVNLQPHSMGKIPCAGTVTTDLASESPNGALSTTPGAERVSETAATLISLLKLELLERGVEAEIDVHVVTAP